MVSEFSRLAYVPYGIERAFKLVEQGLEIIKQQSEFWKRYAQIEDIYSKNLQSLLTLPCSTWESKEGLFGKKKILSESGKSMEQTWKTVKNSVLDISNRHQQIAEGLYQQGHIPLETLIQQIENEIKQLSENIQVTSGTIATNYKNLKKVRQQYIKLSQSHKTIDKLLDDPQLPYEKRQKLEIQASQLKLELDNVFRSYKTLVESTGNLQRDYYTKSAPQVLDKLEKLESDRIKQIKGTYSKYVANTYTVIPTMRQLCDKLIYFTDLINNEDLQSKFVYSILVSLKEPLKPPKIPRLKPFGDTNDEDIEDDIISSDFNKMMSTMKSSYNISMNEDSIKIKEIIKKQEPKPPRPSSNQFLSPSREDNNPNDIQEEYNKEDDIISNENTNKDISTEDLNDINTNNIQDNTLKEDKEINKSTKETENIENIENKDSIKSNESIEESNIQEDIQDSNNENNKDNSNDNTIDNEEDKVISKPSVGWIDDMLSGGPSNSTNDTFSLPSSVPFQSTLPSHSTLVNTNSVDFMQNITTSSKHLKSSQEIINKQELNNNNKQEQSNIKKEQQENIINEDKVIIKKDKEEPIKELSETEKIKKQLDIIVLQNDYYSLFEVSSSDTLSTITKKRKEINNRLHPDNFNPLSTEKEEAVQKLVKINDIYSSVFRNDKTKKLYDKLCAYRMKYDSLLNAPNDLLQRAVTNLNLVGKTVKRANLPEDLFTEISLVLELIKCERNITPQ